MKDLFKFCSKLSEIFPIVLISLLFVSEINIHNHIKNTAFWVSCQFLIVLFMLGIFFLFVVCYKYSKNVILVVCLLLWFLFIYIKHRCVN